MRRHIDTLTRRVLERLRRLHELVWAPLAGAVDRARRVTVVPHGQLAALPFAALTGDDGPLVERHRLALAGSARHLLHGLSRPPCVAVRALALGESSRLPHAADEARLVASRFRQSSAGVGEQATLELLRAQAGDADVVHLACHAEFRSDNPLFSALHLADGALTAEQAEKLVLRPGVVVLSACETGLATHAPGDEMLGLVRAFLVAGAARVLASLWPVDDAVTADFMSRLYDELQTGAAPADALRTAQLHIRASHPHPFHWAAFAVHGGW